MITVKRKKYSYLMGYEKPTLDKLASGSYKSILREIRNAEQERKDDTTGKKEIVGIDCFHDLFSVDGKLFKVRFRYYASSDQVEELAQVLERYGLEGKIGDVKDVNETVILSPVGEKSRYLYISARDQAEVE